MLEAAKTYRDNEFKLINIGGRIKDYSPSAPFVWSLGGDWYDEQSGAFVMYTPQKGHYLLPVDCRRSISDHTEVNVDPLTGEVCNETAGR